MKKIICSFNFVTFPNKKTVFLGERRGKYTIGMNNVIKKYPDCTGTETFYCYSKEQREQTIERLGLSK